MVVKSMASIKIEVSRIKRAAKACPNQYHFALLALSLSNWGCREAPIDYSSLKLVAVSGVVTLDGKPLEGARVQFIGADGAGSEGITDSTGRYGLRYDSAQMGATPGPKTVKITMDHSGEADDPDAERPEESLPAKYNKQSELRVEVSEASRTHNFPLFMTK